MKNIKAIDKKIFFISTEFYPGPGGIGTHAYYIINELKKLGWNFKIFTNQYSATDSEIEKFNKNYHSEIVRLWDTPTVIQLIKKIKFLINKAKEFKPDLIITSGKHATWFGAAVKLFTGIKLVAIGHGTEFGIDSKKGQKINKLSYKYADMIISVSNFTRNYIYNTKKINTKINIVIYNGADHELYKPIEKAEIEIFKKNRNITDLKIILTVGNVSERKGQFVVIQSLAEIIKKVGNVHYYCIGMPSQADEFMNIAKELKVEKNVHFLGKLPKDEILMWINACDVFAMTSTHTNSGDFEGFGIAVIEAALCRKASVVTKDTSGVIESIVDGETGLGVIEKDYSDTANAFIKLLSDNVLLERLSENAYNRAIKDFTWESQAIKYDKELLDLFII